MSWEQIHAHWPDCERLARKRWHELSKSDLAQVAGDRDRLAAQLRKRYGMEDDEVERQLREFQWSCDSDECV